MSHFPDLPLRTARLELRPLQEQDADALFSIFSDPEAMRFWSEPPWTEHDDASQLVAQSLASLGRGSALCLVLAPITGGPVVGYLNL